MSQAIRFVRDTETSTTTTPSDRMPGIYHPSTRRPGRQPACWSRRRQEPSSLLHRLHWAPSKPALPPKTRAAQTTASPAGTTPEKPRTQTHKYAAPCKAWHWRHFRWSEVKLNATPCIMIAKQPDPSVTTRPFLSILLTLCSWIPVSQMYDNCWQLRGPGLGHTT